MARQPLGLTIDMAKYIMKQKVKGNKRFPMVLMLEPTEMCNLTCTGCGKIRQAPEVLKMRLSAEECFAAVDECGAPAVSIAGGEPLVHPEIVDIVKGMLARKKLTMLCTNGILLHRVLDKLEPDPRFTFVFHLDGKREHHDKMVERKGVYDIVIKGIKAAKERGFRVATNTTLYKGASAKDTAELLQELMEIGVDNSILSPAFTYEEVDPSHSDIFLHRKEVNALVQDILDNAKGKVRFYDTPMYFDFLLGKKDLRCTPWGNPTRNPKGWKGPCYLLTDGHYDTFEEMMNQTNWEEFGYGENPRCASCMMHSGYEASAVGAMTPKDTWRLVRWFFAS
ncbi:adenosyl-hopene transferase HpnH [Alicyclobacillus acidoterrestris]|uniref:Adenosyl-hopene transferase HpnH n=1 Tax=Alicyclobacillus acidoterrestris (strain ATCC 49025 / DSM 3922 / CIP 106132 / NCIMB 13137 / GD3B) TaxID=1356854 RepID=A0A9E6ZJS2_ALIAG|nr:adenosyl-hopene transferase HpnH [Alicyclobacillus acidoterrestris]UNO48676.1 adenosyl-hopene transferase HpnH [Alicyclobacillus acidoterrestris]